MLPGLFLVCARAASGKTRASGFGLAADSRFGTTRYPLLQVPFRVGNPVFAAVAHRYCVGRGMPYYMLDARVGRFITIVLTSTRRNLRKYNTIGRNYSNAEGWAGGC